MASQLASQLQILKGGGKPLGGAIKDGRYRTAKPSFLFDANTAQDIDNQTVYEMGLNGLAELRRMDERFAPFEETLFNIASNGGAYDREAQTPATLKKLDQSIASFLRVLSPYFLLKPAHKVLEFLIRRYKVQDECSESLLECILPFHATTIFGRMLMLIKLTKRWEFLKDAQKAGSPVARATIVARCIADRSVLEFICESAFNLTTIGRSPAQHRIGLNLYTVVVVDVLAAKSVREEHVATLVRYISEGIKAKGFPEYRTASYMLLARLCSRMPLSEAVVASLMAQISKRIPTDASVHSVTQALLPVVCMCQTQKLATFPHKSFALLAKVEQLTAAVASISSSFDINPFLRLFLATLAAHQGSQEDRADVSSYSNLLVQFISSVSIGRHVPALTKSLLDCYSSTEEADQDALRMVLLELDTQYPEEMTASLRTQLQQTTKDQDETKHKALVEVVSWSFRGTRHEMLEQADTTVFLALAHPIAEVRVSAVERVQAMLQEGQADALLTASLLNCLTDREPVVVLAVLGIEKLIGALDKDALLEALLCVLDDVPGAKQASRNRVICAVFNQLLELMALDADFPSRVMPYFMQYVTVTGQTIKVSQKLISMIPKFAKSSFKKLFQGLDVKELVGTLKQAAAFTKDKKSTKKKKKKSKASSDASHNDLVASVNRAIVSHLGTKVAASDELFDAMLGVFSSEAFERGQWLALCALDSAMHHTKDIDSLVARLAPLLRAKWTASDEVAAVAAPAGTIIPSDFPEISSLLVHVHKTMLQTLPAEDVSEDRLASLRELFIFYVSCGSPRAFDAHVALLFQRFLVSLDQAFAFLMPFWTSKWASPTECLSQVGTVPTACVVSSFHIAHALLLTASQAGQHVSVDQVLPSLLIGVTNQSKAVRHAALMCLQSLDNDLDKLCQPTSMFLRPLMTMLVDVRDEFLADCSFLCPFFDSCFTEDKLRADVQAQILEFLMAFVSRSDNTFAQFTLVSSLVAGVAPSALVQHALPLLSSILENPPANCDSREAEGAEFDHLPQLVGLLIKQLCSETIGSEGALSLLTTALECPLVFDGTFGTLSVKRATLAQIDGDLFTSLNEQEQHDLFELLVTLFREDNSSAACQDTLRRIPIRAALISQRLTLSLELASEASKAAAQASSDKDKAQAMSDSDDDESSSEDEGPQEEDPATASLTKVVSLLEMLQFVLTNANLLDAMQLVNPLFCLLSALLHPNLQLLSIEYPKQLTLSTLLTLFNRGSSLPAPAADAEGNPALQRTLSFEDVDGVSTKDLDLSSVVQCIVPSDHISSSATGAQKSQTRNGALRLLSVLAALVPQMVLDVVVPIFSHIYTTPAKSAAGSLSGQGFREDDSYTFSVIQQTIETVIPPIIQHGLSLSVSPLVEIFVDAACKMSSDRAIRLLTVFHSTLAESYRPAQEQASSSREDSILQVNAAASSNLPLSQLHQAIALVTQRVLQHNADNGPKKRGQPLGQGLEMLQLRTIDTLFSQPNFSHDLCRHFSASEQVGSLVRLLGLVDSVEPSSDKPAKKRSKKKKKKKSSKGQASSIAEVLQNCLDSEVASDGWKVSIMRFVVSHLGKQDFLQRVDKLKGDNELEQQFLCLFESLLTHLRRFNEELLTADLSSHKKDYTRCMVECTNRALDQLNKLLSVESFVSVVMQLLANPLSYIRRKALQLLTSRVRDSGEDASEEHIRLYLTILPALRKLVLEKGGQSHDKEDSTDEDRTVVMVLDSLQSLSEALALQTLVDCKPEFLQLLPPVLQTVQSRHEEATKSKGPYIPTKVAAAGLRCLGGISKMVDVQLLPQLKPLVSTTVKILEHTFSPVGPTNNKSGKRARDQAAHAPEDGLDDKSKKLMRELQSGALECIQSVVCTVPTFMSPFLEQIAAALLHPSLPDPPADGDEAMEEQEEGEDQLQLVFVAETLHKMAEDIEARVILPVVCNKLLDKALELGDRSVKRVYWLLGAVVGTFTPQMVKAELKQVFRFLLRESFDLRRKHADKLQDVDSVEQAVVAATMKLIVKLRESQLKALFVKTVQWLDLPAATEAGEKSADLDDDVLAKVNKNMDRCAIFFRLVLALVSTLKEIFIPYVGIVMHHCVLVLQAGPVPAEDEPTRSVKKKRRTASGSKATGVSSANELRATVGVLVVNALHKAFEFDSDRFFSKEAFDKLIPALVNQMDLGKQLRSQERYAGFVEDHLGPCLEEMAVRMASATLWKPLNHAVLLMSRSELPAIRLASMAIISRFFTRLREQWLFLLPETIPYIAELMEDAEIHVEQQCQLLIKEIEKLSGESLAHYLT